MHDDGVGSRRIARQLGLPWAWVNDIVLFRRRPYTRVPIPSILE
jgi:hypothetical protein